MDWVTNLIDLYEKNDPEVGKIVTKEYMQGGKMKKGISYTLLPIAHTTALAQVEVTIDGNGNFLHARELDKSEAFTIIPCTISSGARAGAVISPHTLCDNLKYIAGDYDLYMKEGEDSCQEKYNTYMKALRDWKTSEYTHPKVNAIYQFLSKRELIHDLIDYKVIHTDKDGLPEDYKIQGISQMDAFVRFCVDSGQAVDTDQRMLNTNGNYHVEVWLDRTLIENFIQYYDAINEEKGLCYLTGRRTFLSELHPKKIRNDGDGTKLISGNDSSGYTYRGRFIEKSDAMGVSYEASQKAHNALKWIIRKQGYNRDGVCIVTWASDMIPTITAYESTSQLIERITGIQEETESEDLFDLEESEEQASYDTKEIAAKSLAKAIEGYRLSFKNLSKMVIMSFDAATPGRLAMIYYKELERSKYLENIAFWQETCSWRHITGMHGKPIFYDGMPCLREIAYALYGIDQEGRMILHSSSDGKAPMMVSTFQRLIPCILEQRKIPRDMVRAAVNRASMPLAYSTSNWRKILSVACSMVKKERYDYISKEEEWSMDSEMKDIRERSFLYGRLLAIADRIEYTTYEQEDKRVTNAKRYMNMFSQRPYSTWMNIEERIQPYLQKQPMKSREYYEHVLNEVMSLFDINEFEQDVKLEGLYLLGFHKQSNEFWKSKKSVDESVNEKKGE